jgi:hypothetical protein
MDMLVPVMFCLATLAMVLVAVAGSWALFKWVRRAWQGTGAGPGPRGAGNSALAAWNRFWFTPRDPTVLGAMRILCGAITTYTVFAYSFMLQDFMGKDGWYDLPLRLEVARTRPNIIGPLMLPHGGPEYAAGVARTPEEKKYKEDYKKRWGLYPPAPFPTSDEEAAYLDSFRLRYGIDLRYFGLATPRNEEDAKLQYIDDYMNHPANVLKRPPPAFPNSAKESEEIFDYMAKHRGLDPRLAYTIGQPSWSIWFHVTDPTAMNVIHVLAVLACFLFTIGLATRLTSVLTWMTSLWYIHRDPVALFGVDTMMMILLLYLMIGPSGAALSVDRLITRWWRAWRAKKPAARQGEGEKGRQVESTSTSLPFSPSPDLATFAPSVAFAPPPSVSCNVAIRLIQINLCFIYFVSGISKLQGAAWWNGTAVWGTLANFEFAPMAFEINGIQVYNDFLRFLGSHQLLLDIFLTGACLFTLAFEIGFAFLVWRPSLRWWVLSGAIILHGFIGLLMGLKTFSLMMLVMNMAFLRREEVDAALRWFGRLVGQAGPPESGTRGEGPAKKKTDALAANGAAAAGKLAEALAKS